MPKLSKHWRSLLADIPGYDPFRDAGDCVFDVDAAQLALDFFPECLSHVKGELAGTPLKLERWQQAIIANLFGWKRLDGTRRYREAFIYVARKNGKSTFAAGIVCLVLFTDGEPGAEIYSAAAERDQAALVFDQAKGMVNHEPELSTRARIYVKSITLEEQGSSYKAISADANTKHGYNTHLAVIDELHAHKDRELVDVLITSTGSRRQPLIIHITTADYERESICNEKLDYAGKVRDGIVEDPSFLPVIFEADVKDDWTDREIWKLANPNMGVSVSEEYLVRECERAKQTPAYENTFKRLHLNIKTEQVSRWIPMDAWQKCTGVTEPRAWRTEQLEALQGHECIGGLDLGSTSDLTALALMFRNEHAGRKYTVLPWFWVPEAGLHRKDHKHKELYQVWIRQGFVTPTSGDVADYGEIRTAINVLAEQYGIVDLAVDRLFQGAQLCTDLMNDGFEVTAFGQGFLSMAAPAKEFEEIVLAGELEHGNNPVLNWMASNVSVKTDAAGCMKPMKPPKESSLKIDGIVSTIMALGRWMVRDDEKSTYESEGLLIL